MNEPCAGSSAGSAAGTPAASPAKPRVFPPVSNLEEEREKYIKEMRERERPTIIRTGKSTFSSKGVDYINSDLSKPKKFKKRLAMSTGGRARTKSFSMALTSSNDQTEMDQARRNKVTEEKAKVLRKQPLVPRTDWSQPDQSQEPEVIVISTDEDDENDSDKIMGATGGKKQEQLAITWQDFERNSSRMPRSRSLSPRPGAAHLLYHRHSPPSRDEQVDHYTHATAEMQENDVIPAAAAIMRLDAVTARVDMPRDQYFEGYVAEEKDKPKVALRMDLRERFPRSYLCEHNRCNEIFELDDINVFRHDCVDSSVLEKRPVQCADCNYWFSKTEARGHNCPVSPFGEKQKEKKVASGEEEEKIDQHDFHNYDNDHSPTPGTSYREAEEIHSSPSADLQYQDGSPSACGYCTPPTEYWNQGHFDRTREELGLEADYLADMINEGNMSGPQ